MHHYPDMGNTLILSMRPMRHLPKSTMVSTTTTMLLLAAAVTLLACSTSSASVQGLSEMSDKVDKNTTKDSVIFIEDRDEILTMMTTTTLNYDYQNATTAKPEDSKSETQIVMQIKFAFQNLNLTNTTSLLDISPEIRVKYDQLKNIITDKCYAINKTKNINIFTDSLYPLNIVYFTLHPYFLLRFAENPGATIHQIKYFNYQGLVKLARSLMRECERNPNEWAPFGITSMTAMEYGGRGDRGPEEVDTNDDSMTTVRVDYKDYDYEDYDYENDDEDHIEILPMITVDYNKTITTTTAKPKETRRSNPQIASQIEHSFQNLGFNKSTSLFDISPETRNKYNQLKGIITSKCYPTSKTENVNVFTDSLYTLNIVYFNAFPRYIFDVLDDFGATVHQIKFFNYQSLVNVASLLMEECKRNPNVPGNYGFTSVTAWDMPPPPERGPTKEDLEAYYGTTPYSAD